MGAVNATRFLFYFRKNKSLFVLLLIWAFGLFAGIYFYILVKPPIFLQMRSVIFQPVSIVGLIFSLFLPLLCTYVAVSLNKPIIILIVCFFKAVAFGFTYSWISVLFGSASWLVRLLFMFSDYCFLHVLFALWIQFSSKHHDFKAYDFCFSILLALIVTAADYLLVSPFVIGLF